MRRSAITTFLRFAPSADFGTSSGEYGATPLEPRRRKMANGTWRQVEATFELNRRQLTRFIPHGRSQCRLPSLAAQNSMGHHASEWWRLPRRVRGRRHCRGGCCSSARAALSKKTARTIHLIDCATKLFTTRITKPVRRSRSLFVASGAHTSHLRPPLLLSLHWMGLLCFTCRSLRPCFQVTALLLSHCLASMSLPCFHVTALLSSRSLLPCFRVDDVCLAVKLIMVF